MTNIGINHLEKIIGINLPVLLFNKGIEVERSLLIRSYNGKD
jgi:hypothetical protein